MKNLLEKHKDKTILCISHNGISKAMMAVITKKKPEEIETIENLPNSGYKIFELESF